VTDLDLIEHLYRAVASPLGIVVECDDVLKLRSKLYPLRKDRPEFQHLAFIPSPLNPRELFIVNKDQSDGS